jgi:hypothetical protein
VNRNWWDGCKSALVGRREPSRSASGAAGGGRFGRTPDSPPGGNQPFGYQRSSTEFKPLHARAGSPPMPYGGGNERVGAPRPLPRTASVTVFRISSPVISSPAFPGRPRPGNHAGRRDGQGSVSSHLTWRADCGNSPETNHDALAPTGPGTATRQSRDDPGHSPVPPDGCMTAFSFLASAQPQDTGTTHSRACYPANRKPGTPASDVPMVTTRRARPRRR